MIVAVLRREGAIADDSLYPLGAYRTVSNDRLVSLVRAVVEVEDSALSDALVRLYNAGVVRERPGPNFRGAYILTIDYKKRLEELSPTS